MPQSDTPAGTIPLAIDAIIFNPDDTVTIHYADPARVSRNPKVRSAETLTVDFDTNENIIETVTAILESGCDLVAYAQEAARAPSARIPGR